MDHARVGMAVEDGDLTGDAIGLAAIVVAEHGDELPARLAHDRVVGLGDPAVGLVTDDPQARVVEAREDLATAGLRPPSSTTRTSRSR